MWSKMKTQQRIHPIPDSKAATSVEEVSAEQTPARVPLQEVPFEKSSLPPANASSVEARSQNSLLAARVKQTRRYRTKSLNKSIEDQIQLNPHQELSLNDVRSVLESSRPLLQRFEEQT